MARQKIEVEIKVVGTQAQVKIKQLDDAFRDAAKGADMMNEAINNGSKLLKGSVGDLRRQIKALELVRDNTAKTTKQFFEQDKQIQKLRNRVSAITDTNSKFAKVNQDLISSSGLAGATLTELGRTISDMPYGIRGVTNNLSQLSTLMVTLMAKTGGTTKAFQLLGAQLRGPLGLILAFQAVIAAIDFFFGSTKKAEEATEDLTDAISRQTQKLKELAYTEDQIEYFRNKRGIVNKRRIKETGDNLRNTVKILSSEFSEFNDMFQSMTDLSDESVNNLIDDFQQLLKNREFQATLEKRIAENRAKQSELEGEDLKRLLRDRKRLQDALKKTVLESIDIQRKYQKESFEAFAMDIEDIGEVYAATFEDVFKKIDQSFDKYGFFKKGEEPLTVLENFYDDGIEALLEFNRFRENFIERSELEILDIMQEQALARLLILAKESEGLIDFETEKIKIIEFFAKKRSEIINKDADRNRQELNRNIRELQDMLGQLQNVMNMMSDAEFSREERKTVMLNNQLKERLRNEQLSADERERINKQIENNELKLQKKRDEIAERNFKLQKAFAMAQAAINTALAVSDVLAREKKGLIGKTAAAIIIGALGAAQIAAIAKTKFVPSASAMPSGQAGVVGSAGGGAQDPIFNIVGTGQQFQLSQAIAQRTGEPVRAYVVTGDVRSGLALERNIIKGSKLG